MVAHIKKDSSAVDFNPFCDLGKTFEQFKMPAAKENMSAVKGLMHAK
jgi:hypothetical protein